MERKIPVIIQKVGEPCLTVEKAIRSRNSKNKANTGSMKTYYEESKRNRNTRNNNRTASTKFSNTWQKEEHFLGHYSRFFVASSHLYLTPTTCSFVQYLKRAHLPRVSRPLSFWKSVSVKQLSLFSTIVLSNVRKGEKKNSISSCRETIDYWRRVH